MMKPLCEKKIAGLLRFMHLINDIYAFEKHENISKDFRILSRRFSPIVFHARMNETRMKYLFFF